MIHQQKIRRLSLSKQINNHFQSVSLSEEPKVHYMTTVSYLKLMGVYQDHWLSVFLFDAVVWPLELGAVCVLIVTLAVLP